MKTGFPIKLSVKELEIFDNCIFQLKTYIYDKRQGDFSIDEVSKCFYKLSHKITVFSGNFYDCDGVIVFALKLSNRFNSPIRFDNENYVGIKLARVPKHLKNYYPV